MANMWSMYVGKKVFLRTNKERIYIGIVKEVVDVGSGVIFISMITIKEGRWVTVTSSEIAEIKEEE